ncbi:bifunctional diguanylate cyclase/phosphodiesterase [Ammoniphilus sp. CFH 90114]|uniref:putative bifunctional diguanylate cyclase/phosphodiesterase n=1 Tax=Ammoniphilus sp. CFH 90114 TaxID=2493665 RepID=UPI0013E97070|nr:EAL domain-containing protein [Ammoniphilus sp. CFH 90114]
MNLMFPGRPHLSWAIPILYFLPIINHISLSPTYKIFWLLHLIPAMFLTFYYGLRGGLIGASLSLVLCSLTEFLYYNLGVAYTYENIYSLIVYNSVNFMISIGMGFLTDRLKKQQQEIKNINQVLLESNQRLKQNEEKIRHLAYYDSLTGLPNRHYFQEQLKEKLDAIDEQVDQQIAVMIVDLDRFKVINDTLGHEFGDLLLRQVAHRLTSSLGNDEIICRQGGDEFFILLGDTSAEETKLRAEHILWSISFPYMINDHELYVTPSIGISFYPQDGTSSDELLKHADSALYRAKELGKNRYHFFTEDMDGQNSKRLQLESGLRRALDKKEFKVYYQPKVDIRTGEWIATEALLRWNHTKLGAIPPDQFIPLAEETGLIVPIGEWVIREACKQNKKWQDEGYGPLTVCVNISTRQFLQDRLLRVIESALEESGLPPQYLNLEITESVAMTDVDRCIEKLNQLRSLGVRLSLDDFGTGFSSLSYLKRFPIDILKIDQSFIQDMLRDTQDAAIVRTIINVALNLNLIVTAEGVETSDHLEFLANEGCQEAQGYYFSRPLPAYELEEKLPKKPVSL